MYGSNQFQQGKIAERACYHLIFVLLMLCLACSTKAIAQVSITTLHAFGSNPNGEWLYFPPIQGQDGAYYGTAEAGGQYGYGTVYKIDSTGNVIVLHSFSLGTDGGYPYGRLTQTSDGTLYGTASDGGSNGWGTVYKIHTDGTGFTVLHSFSGPGGSDGSEPIGGVIQASDGDLYGTTIGVLGYGSVFKLSKDGSTFQTIYNFTGGSDGDLPTAGLIQGKDGKLYGTTLEGGTNGYGTVFLLSIDGTVFKILHTFNSSDGADPEFGVIQGKDGQLYGTTVQGGTNNWGTVFQVSTDGTVFHTLHSFNDTDGANPGGLIQGSDGSLYGVAGSGPGGGGQYGDGIVYKLSTDGSIYNILHAFSGPDGIEPAGNVIQGSDGLLHGVTFNSSNIYIPAGTFFTVDTNGTTFTTIYDLATGYTDAENPEMDTFIRGKDGAYYGTGSYGGQYGNGALFKVTSTGQVTTLHSFNNTDGALPQTGLAIDSKGNIFGTTSVGGANNDGVVFEYSPSSSFYTVLFNFGNFRGPSYPILVIGGNLYGVTDLGGQYSYGTIYKITLPTSTTPLRFQILHSFSGTDGEGPCGRLIQGSDKYLYGTCVGGGENGYGTVFRFSPSKGTLTVLHSFDETHDGGHTSVGIIQGSDGNLYGTTPEGGIYGYGTVYQVSKDGISFNVLHSFSNDSNGGTPYSPVIQASDGLLYGTTYRGGINGWGTVFNLNLDGSTFNTLHQFNWETDGATTYTGVIEGPDGNLYGATYEGGAVGQGTAFSLFTRLPIVKSFSPTFDSASGGTIVTIKGVNFTGATITIAGVSQTVQTDSATTIKIQLNTATPIGTFPILVTTAHGTVTSTKQFTVTQ